MSDQMNQGAQNSALDLDKLQAIADRVEARGLFNASCDIREWIELARRATPAGREAPTDPTPKMIGAGARAMLRADADKQASSLTMAKVCWDAMAEMAAAERANAAPTASDLEFRHEMTQLGRALAAHPVEAIQPTDKGDTK